MSGGFEMTPEMHKLLFDEVLDNIGYSQIQKTIANYVLRSAGTCNHLSNHTVTCFVGMIETGEATWEDFQAVGGQELVDTIQERWEAIR